MSYLGWPRLHFSGRFQADTSTINNDVRHYKSDTFEPQFQAPMIGHGQGGATQRTNGYWNPDGTGAWRMLGCRISGAARPGQLLTDEREDPVLGLHIGGSNDRVAGKLVDLDPQQQLVSEIWGLRIALEDAQGNRLFDSEFDVAAFIDLWKRQQVMENFDQTLAAAYQSTLSNVAWGDLSGYPLVQELQAACADGLLSIRFNVFGFDRDPTADDYTTGAVVGTIGPATPDEPKHFVLGRQLVAATDPAKGPFSPTEGVFGFQAVNHANGILTADLGNSLPIHSAAGDLEDIGELSLAVARNKNVRHGDTVNAGEVAILGPIDYLDEGWLQQCAGIVDFDYRADAWLADNLADHPLVLLGKGDSGQYRVLVRETLDGLYVRADQFVYRLDPGSRRDVDFYVTRYGNPAAATLSIQFDDAGISITSPGTGAVLPADKWPVPKVGTPEQALHFETTLAIDDSGHGRLNLASDENGPCCPRGYLDGQLYALRYTIDGTPRDYHYNFWNFISVLCFDLWPIPDEPTWYGHIEPIFQQYANLYPIMSRYLVDLADYDSVVEFTRPLILSFSLPQSDSNSMPVSRDLSANKRKGILEWLTTPGPDGKPVKGTVDQRKPAGPPRWKVEPPQAEPGARQSVEPGGKFDFMSRLSEAQKEADDAEN